MKHNFLLFQTQHCCRQNHVPFFWHSDGPCCFSLSQVPPTGQLPRSTWHSGARPSPVIRLPAIYQVRKATSRGANHDISSIFQHHQASSNKSNKFDKSIRHQYLPVEYCWVTRSQHRQLERIYRLFKPWCTDLLPPVSNIHVCKPTTFIQNHPQLQEIPGALAHQGITADALPSLMSSAMRRGKSLPPDGYGSQQHPGDINIDGKSKQRWWLMPSEYFVLEFDPLNYIITYHNQS